MQPQSPTRGLRSSPPACTASLVVGNSKAPWPWPATYAVYEDYQRTQPCDCSITPVLKYVAIWMSWNINIPWSLNSSDTFPRRKFENWPPRSCRPGLILSTSTVSFELHVKVAEIYVEMYIYGQLSEVQMVRDLDLGPGQGHINIHITCRTTCRPNHVIVPLRSTEIWPFECR